jgi:hypothetical protein
MKIRLLIVAAVMLSMAISCKQAKKPATLSDQIAALETELFGEDADYNIETALKLRDAYIRFADSLPHDSLSPYFIFKAADISVYQNDPQRTIWLLDRLMMRYPEHEKSAISLFLKAFVYDTQMQDTASARVFYTNFINQHPEHEFAADAAIAIRNLGKTPEDLIREFERLNSQ